MHTFSLWLLLPIRAVPERPGGKTCEPSALRGLKALGPTQATLVNGCVKDQASSPIPSTNQSQLKCLRLKWLSLSCLFLSGTLALPPPQDSLYLDFPFHFPTLPVTYFLFLLHSFPNLCFPFHSPLMTNSPVRGRGEGGRGLNLSFP